MNIISCKAQIRKLLHYVYLSACDFRTGSWRVRALITLGATIIFGPYVLWPFLYPEAGVYFGDDAFYYLVPAVRFWETGSFTFDGVTPTNGFHPLWLAVLTMAALPLKLLGITHWLPWVARLLAYVCLLIFAQATFTMLRKAGGSILTAMLAPMTAITSTIIMQAGGLEISILFATIALLLSYVVWIQCERLPPSPLVLGTLSLLVLLSRYDMAVFLLLLYLLLLPCYGFRRVTLSGIVLTLVATPFLALNWAVMGHLMPISGRVKHLWADLNEEWNYGVNFGFTDLLVPSLWRERLFKDLLSKYIAVDINQVLKSLTLGKFDDSVGVYNYLPWLLAVVAILIVIALLLNIRDARTGTLLTPFIAFSALTFAYVFVLLYHAVNSDRVWEWYRTFGVATFAVGGVLLVVSLLPRVLRPWIAGLWLIAIVGNSGTAAVSEMQAKAKGPGGLRGTYVTVGRWLRNQTPDGSRIGSWAAGEIGWEARRNVFNLEGLVGDNDLYDSNARYDTVEYLARHNIAYLANFWRPSIAPMPEQLVTPHPLAKWLNEGSIGYFWALRVRPVLDCPSAFNVLFKHDAKDKAKTFGYVLSVDLDKLKQFLELRQVWFDRVATIGTLIPAESLPLSAPRKIRANVGRTIGKYNDTTKLSVKIGDLANSSHLFARVLNRYSRDVSLSSGVVVPDSDTWQWIELGSISPSPDGNSIEVTTVQPLVFDELLLVPEENVVDARLLPADWM